MLASRLTAWLRPALSLLATAAVLALSACGGGSGAPQDPMLSIRAKQRSIHNNYFTFPLLFLMLSNHFPAAYGHHLN